MEVKMDLGSPPSVDSLYELLEQTFPVEILATNTSLEKLNNRLKVLCTSLTVNCHDEKLVDLQERCEAVRKSLECDEQALLVPLEAKTGDMMVIFDRFRTSYPKGRFARVQVDRRKQKHSKFKLLDKYTGTLVDTGNPVHFNRYECIPIEADALKSIPQQIFTVKLQHLDLFEGTSRLVHVMEDALLQLGHQFMMRIVHVENEANVMKEDNKDAEQAGDAVIEVEMTDGNGVSLNDLIVQKYCDSNGTNFLLDRHYGFGESVQGFLSSVSLDGTIIARIRTPILEAVHKALNDSEDIFHVLKAVHPVIIKDKNRCVGKSPFTNKLERCDVLCVYNERKGNGQMGYQKKAHVQWIDVGGRSDLILSDLLPAYVLSPVLFHAPPLGIKFHLYNIKRFKRKADEELKTKLSALIPFSDPLRIAIMCSNERDMIEPEPPEVVLFQLQGSRRRTLNKILINSGACVAMNPALTVKIPEIKWIQTSPSWTVNEACTPSDWADPTDLVNCALVPGQKVVLRVDNLTALEPLNFVVFCVDRTGRFKLLRDMINAYFLDSEWTKQDLDPAFAENQYCVYVKDKKIYRAKILEALHEKTDPEQRWKLWLIDVGTAVEATKASMLQVVDPWPLLSSHGPQAALASWKRAVDDSKYLDEDYLCKVVAPFFRESLQREFPDGVIEAVLKEFSYDAYGRAMMVLDFGNRIQL